MAVLETEDLTYTYSVGTPFEKTAVNNVSLKIEEGEMIGVMGHTGSGKSTLIQHFNGLLRPTSGRILLDGKDIWADKNDIRSVRFKVGLVFQYPEYQIFEETVYKDIAFGPTNMGLDKTEIDRRVRETAHDLGLSEELMERFVRGDKSRNTEGSGLGLSIARSLTELQKGEMRIEVDGDLFKVTLTFDAV